MRILCVSRQYDQVVGGVERMSIMLMNEMIERGHEAHIISLDKENAVPFYKMHKATKWHRIDIGDPAQKASLKTKLCRMIKFRQIVSESKPDVIIGFQDGAFLSARIYTLFMGVPVIAAERNAPDRFQYLSTGKYKKLIFKTFRLATRITVQCPSYITGYPKFLKNKISVIPNPVPPAVKGELAQPKGNDNETKYLLSVGRLGHQKNYPILLKAFQKIYQECSSWKLRIIGDGNQRKLLQFYINEHNLKDYVELCGEAKNVSKYYKSSHLFCLPSLWEGFPNALAEAMAHGLPSVGFEKCSGVSDLIKHGYNGKLAQNIDDANSLATELKELMNNPELRQSMGQNAMQHVKQFEPKTVFDQWESLFKSIGSR